MYLVHEEMVTYQTNGQTFADFCFKWATLCLSASHKKVRGTKDQRHKEICISSPSEYPEPKHLKGHWSLCLSGLYLKKSITRIAKLFKSLSTKLLWPKDSLESNQWGKKAPTVWILLLDSPDIGFDRPQELKKMFSIPVGYLTCQNPKIQCRARWM